MQKALKSWFYQVWLAIDQLLNAVFCNGMANETMSSNVWRMEHMGRPWGFMRRVIDTFCWFDPDHCRTAHEAYLERLRNPMEIGK